MISDLLRRQFLDYYGHKPGYEVFAPGRANIIGEHTDYNEGYVLPFAIHLGITIIAQTNDQSILRARSTSQIEELNYRLGDPIQSTSSWFRFLLQILTHVQPQQGLDILVDSNMPIGGGVSSSSALTCGLISMIDIVDGLHLSPESKLELAIKAEHGVGVIGGIMDQFTILNARADQAILLDCRDRSTTFVPMILDDHRFYLVNTNVQHNLIDTDYNNRRQQCEQAVDELIAAGYIITSLRDIHQEQLDDIQTILPKTLSDRVFHVVHENRRVLKAVAALHDRDYIELAMLLDQSHIGLSQYYEVSCPELDWCADYARDHEMAMGARMMGGGFGGCTINLAHRPWTPQEISEMNDAYKSTFGIDLSVIEIKASDGVDSKIIG
jgi:galactokinase